MRLILGAVYLTAILALAAACGSPTASGKPATPSTSASSSATGAQQITVTAMDSMRFEPSSIVVRAGQPVEVTLRNVGRMPHDFALAEGVAQPVTIRAAGGETATGTFTMDRPGSYTFICSVPGHSAAGMKGTITVQ